MARPVRPGGGAYPRRARPGGAAGRARRLHVGTRAGRQAVHRHRAGGAGLRRRAVVPARAGGGRLRAADPGAGLVRAPRSQGSGHQREPARFQRRLRRGGPDAAVPRLASPQRRRPGPVRAGQAGAGPAHLAARAALRRRQGPGGAGDHGQGHRRRPGPPPPTTPAGSDRLYATPAGSDRLYATPAGSDRLYATPSTAGIDRDAAGRPAASPLSAALCRSQCPDRRRADRGERQQQNRTP